MLKESLLWARHLLTNVHRVMDAGAGVLSISQVLPKRPREEVSGQTPTPSVVNTTSGSVRDLWTPLNYSTLLPLFTFFKIIIII